MRNLADILKEGVYTTTLQLKSDGLSTWSCSRLKITVSASALASETRHTFGWTVTTRLLPVGNDKVILLYVCRKSIGCYNRSTVRGRYGHPHQAADSALFDQSPGGTRMCVI